MAVIRQVTVEYDGGEYRITLKLHRHSSLRMSHLGKHWPVQTHCVLEINGRATFISNVTKHADDWDDRNFGYRLAASKVISRVKVKTIRKDLWQKVLEEFPVDYI